MRVAGEGDFFVAKICGQRGRQGAKISWPNLFRRRRIDFVRAPISTGFELLPMNKDRGSARLRDWALIWPSRRGTLELNHVIWRAIRPPAVRHPSVRPSVYQFAWTLQFLLLCLSERSDTQVPASGRPTIGLATLELLKPAREGHISIP